MRRFPGGTSAAGCVVAGPDAELARERASAVAEQVGPKFEGMGGLQSKVFMRNDETGTVTNTYVWDSEQAARAFFTPELKATVIELYGAEPDVQFAEVSALIDNRVGVA
jgi:heme-degrading monooxygenase HmoA